MRLQAMNSTLTSKGQLTLPKAARDALQLTTGTRFAFEIVGDKLVLTPSRVNALSVRGILKSPHHKPLSIAEMDEGITRAMREKHGKPVQKSTHKSARKPANKSK
jgi:antitoxin PrlF